MIPISFSCTSCRSRRPLASRHSFLSGPILSLPGLAVVGGPRPGLAVEPGPPGLGRERAAVLERLAEGTLPVAGENGQSLVIGVRANDSQTLAARPLLETERSEVEALVPGCNGIPGKGQQRPVQTGEPGLENIRAAHNPNPVGAKAL